MPVDRHVRLRRGRDSRVWPPSDRSADDVVRLVRRALTLSTIRDLDRDPGHGVQQLVEIGWTTISTSKQNPEPGRHTISALRDLLAHWARDVGPEESDEQPLPVVYRDDVPNEVLHGLELLAVVSTESMQVNAFAEVMRTIVALFDRLPPEQQARSEDLVLRSLSGLADHVLTARSRACFRISRRCFGAPTGPTPQPR